MFLQSNSQKTSVWSWCLGLLVALVLINQLGFCSARYLPTRADESRKEMIKQMLKELMDMPQTYENESRFANSGKSPRYGLAYGNGDGASYLSKRSTSDTENLISRLNLKH